MATPKIPEADLESFRNHLSRSDNILALCGAGLSAASGLPTFRGAGGLWRSRDAVKLASPEAFGKTPGLVWQFYSYRRHMALQAKPNAAHFALAELAKKKEKFLTLTQNVDGLSPRAGHPSSNLHLLHGSLFDLKCSAPSCAYFESNNFTDPIFPALAIPTTVPQPAPLGTATSGEQATESLVNALKASRPSQPKSEELDISDDRVEIPEIRREDIPRCPRCKQGLVRPAVVWFGEALSQATLDAIDEYLDEVMVIELMIVIGTSGQVYPAAGYVEIARSMGAKVAVVNMDADDLPGRDHERKGVDWFFQGDAAAILPQLFRDEIGELPVTAYE